MPASDQGIGEQRYMLIPRTLIFVTHEDQLLLLKGASDKRLWAERYNGIGGHVEQGEDVLSAARREAKLSEGHIAGCEFISKNGYPLLLQLPRLDENDPVDLF